MRKVRNFFVQAHAAEAMHEQMMKDIVDQTPPGMRAVVMGGMVWYEPEKKEKNDG